MTRLGKQMNVAVEFLKSDMIARTSGTYGEDLKAVDTGNFMNNFDKEVTREGLEVIGTISNNTEYAIYIELGTDKMNARPIMRTALIENEDNIGKIFAL